MSESIVTIEGPASDLLERFEITELISHYHELLTRENQRINLVSRETIKKPGALELLSAESLAPLAEIAPETIENHLDIGSGGGFPAIPILLARQAAGAETLDTTLVERIDKKAGALRRMCLSLGVKAKIFADTFELFKPHPHFDFVTIRLVTLTEKILRIGRECLVDGGFLVYYADIEGPQPEGFLLVRRLRVNLDNSGKPKTVSVFRKKPNV